MEELELRLLDMLGGNTHLYGRIIEKMAEELESTIRKILSDSGDAELLAKNSIQIRVTYGEMQGYPGNIWARFFPISPARG